MIADRLAKILIPMLAIALMASLSACGDDTQDADVGVEDASDPDGPAVLPVFDSQGDDFWALPWPMDYRTDELGRPDLSQFPGTRVGLVESYLNVVQESVVGFATMPVVYFQLDGSPGEDVFPTPSESVEPASPLQLLNVSSQGCGQRIPIESRFLAEGDEFRPDNALMAAPVPGLVLDPATTYALVVLRSFGVSAGRQIARPEEFEQILEQTHSDDALIASFQPLVDCAESAGLALSDIGVATVFTTQNPARDLIALREHVVDPLLTPAPQISGWARSDEDSIDRQYITYIGTYQTPMYQHGDPPYNTGGGLVFDDDGVPLVHRWEDVLFTVTWPDDDDPHPILVWQDGTGATLTSHIQSNVIQRALADGFAVASFLPQFHDDRSGFADPEFHTFNINNPLAFRANFPQQVSETSYFVRVIREALLSQAGIPDLQSDILVYGGHSQGAIVGALVAGVETEFRAYMLNGVGAYLSITIVERTDPVDINEVVRGLLGMSERLDRFHPVIALAQMGAEIADPINYGARWRGWDGNPGGSNVLLINGQLDHTTPERSINAMTVSGLVAPIVSPGWNVDPFGVVDLENVDLPVNSNTVSIDGSPLTIATFLSGTNGHYTIYDRRDIRTQAMDYLFNALSGIPTVPTR